VKEFSPSSLFCEHMLVLFMPPPLSVSGRSYFFFPLIFARGRQYVPLFLMSAPSRVLTRLAEPFFFRKTARILPSLHSLFFAALFFSPGCERGRRSPFRPRPLSFFFFSLKTRTPFFPVRKKNDLFLFFPSMRHTRIPASFFRSPIWPPVRFLFPSANRKIIGRPLSLSPPLPQSESWSPLSP